MSSETQKTMVRFDFPPGATPDQIAAAIRAAGERLMKEKAEATARPTDDGTRTVEEKGLPMATPETYDHDKVYKELYARFMQMDVPPCTQCGSHNTASVQVGVIGLTIRLAATCRKFKLIGNGPKPGNWFCNSCQQFFNIPDETDKGALP